MDAVLFDLDGTLINSGPTACAAFVSSFRSCVGIGRAPVAEFLAAQWATFRGNP